MRVYLDTNAIQHAVRLHHSAQQLEEALAATGCDLSLGGHVMYELARAFTTRREERNVRIANERKHVTLTELRACLFFEQCRWRHIGEEPDEEAMKYIRHLVALIRREGQHRA